MHGGIGPQHMVVGQDVGESEALDLLGVGAHRTHVGADLGLGEDDTDSHGRLSTPCLSPVGPAVVGRPATGAGAPSPASHGDDGMVPMLPTDSPPDRAGHTGLDGFHPAVATWFARRFPAGPSAPQEQGWPLIAQGTDTLIAAPTGSGKTLAGFLVAIDAAYRAAARGEDIAGTRSGWSTSPP